MASGQCRILSEDLPFPPEFIKTQWLGQVRGQVWRDRRNRVGNRIAVALVMADVTGRLFLRLKSRLSPLDPYQGRMVKATEQAERAGRST